MSDNKQKNINIIIVYDYAKLNGGAAKIAIQSAIALSKFGYRVYYYSAVGPVEKELSYSKVSVTCLNLYDINQGNRFKAVINGIWNRRVAMDFDSFLSSFSTKNTIVHIHGWSKALSAAVVKSAQRRGFKTILSLHDYFSICPNGSLYDYKAQKICNYRPMSFQCVFCNCDKRNYYQKIWRCVRQLVQDRIIRLNPNLTYIAVSDKLKTLVLPYLSSTKIYCVNNPIQVTHNIISDHSKSNIYLYVGRISAEKGVDLFCKTIECVMSEYNIRGIVIGDGDLLKSFRNTYKNIEFLGWLSNNEVYEYMQKARVLVFPSKWYEAAPLTVVEAILNYLPCIVSDVTTAASLIKDKKNGFLFQSSSHESLKSKIIESLNDKLINIIQNNLQENDISEQYSVSHYTSNIERIVFETIE